MKKNNLIPTISFAIILFLIITLTIHLFAQKSAMKPTPKLITLDQFSPESVKILNGSPETVTMRSGFMVLAPSKSVGRHSTKNNEEAIVVMSGKGEFRIIGGLTFQLHPHCIVYCPPNTEHDVVNTGTDTLRYIYIVARAEE
jgi:quercetin dioxygenase-like cupin family protein